ncbi:MAG TPA: alpha/beta hydrolase fold domain-containing protein [Motilibacteraceae bacterium]|nr:alpha/beta hydrolase fold domain-containing protein [Motilibacteraceae bacterium]
MTGRPSLPRLPAPAARVLCRLALRPALALPVPAQRRWLDLLAHLPPLPPGTRVLRARLGGVPVEVVRPARPGPEAAGRVIVHLHGGAYLTGSPRSHRPLAAAVAAAAGLDVVVPDYRLAPEHPFPAALDDALAVVHALADQGRTVALSGDSAGAGLALAATLDLPPDRRPAALALLSPWLDLTAAAPWRRHRVDQPVDRDPVLTRRWLELGCRAYAGVQPADPRVSPLPALLRDGIPPLPPVLVLSGAEDPLVADADRLVAALQAAGRAVRHERSAGLWHDVPTLAGMAVAADELCATVGRFLAEPDAQPDVRAGR